MLGMLGAGVFSNPLMTGIVSIIDKIIPDKDMKERFVQELSRLEVQGDLEIAIRQIEVNMMEARHPSIYVAGWRPAVGWVCAFAFGWQFLVQPILTYILIVFGVEISVPNFDMVSLLGVLGGMLGFGGFRTFEKINGSNRDHWGSR